VSDAAAPLRSNLAVAVVTLLSSSSTLICCAVPALLVAIGAGATLAGLVTAIPQLVWLSEHKAWVFGISGAMLAVAGIMQWRARRLACPADPVLGRMCQRLRRAGAWTYGASLAVYVGGVLFAFVLPVLMA
jgi:hypothetical protein